MTLLAKRNVNHVAGSQEVQTQDLIDYHSPRDREQHSTRELFRYREGSNKVAFTYSAAIEKIYAHKSLTFNDTIACEVLQREVGTDFIGGTLNIVVGG
ncbi:hypothetical protein Tco_0769896 [Tanacetum coccineum]|uniref:Uncharacterized protein n=1 Tax=Tanacetum coccineum TaxID=301880 RepID=A0ABQ4ZBP3_9ASTR